MRFIFILFSFICLAFSNNILTLEQAFKIENNTTKEGIKINLILGENIYLYDDKIKILLNDKDITSLLNLKKPVKKGEEYVHYNDLNVTLSNELLQNYTEKENILKFSFQGCSTAGLCYQPQTRLFNIVKNNEFYEFSSLQAPIKKENNQNSENSIASFLANSNIFVILLSFYGYGLLLSLTPCVLPMIPILSSFIIAQSGLSKKYSFFLAFIYVFFMSLAYALAGILASFLGTSVQVFLQKPNVLIIFALLFVFFAFAMFDIVKFELPLRFQSFIYNTSNKKKGIFGIALMGFLSALIVGPCIAPPLAGALLYIANSNDILIGGLSLFIMSFGMGTPLLFIGFGIGFLRPGPWMIKIKIFFGFIMLGLSIWILSRIIDTRFILIMFGILGVFFVVFMGLFEKNESAFEKIKKSVLILILSYSLSIFLAGIFGAKSFLRPFEFNNTQNSSLNFNYLSNLNDIKELIAKEELLMLDFTAKWCENCKLLDEFTFKDERVKNILNSYKLVKIDITQSSEKNLRLMKEFNVFAPPVILFFNKGVENTRITGFISANELLNILDKEK
ncbi:protein-disulfide reductase DsbD [Campylobacter sp. LR264d]|uniref:protein-disulfide reductase DsbD n=1 Tax=Campylobacter sp. LR264d TaxID=2593544 RepID=UPI00123C5869|nr:protein-disulfide reductase DsbD [Campylobacter sp. LR264d]KAA6233737.1 protein-disulfide reductase DsbD [Campylobacter sp. LR264d]